MNFGGATFSNHHGHCYSIYNIRFHGNTVLTVSTKISFLGAIVDYKCNLKHSISSHPNLNIKFTCVKSKLNLNVPLD